MDPITARAALRLPPAAPLTLAQVEAAHRAEVWAHHPSRYADRAGRAAAVAWVQSLDAARAALHAQLAGATPPSPDPGAFAQRSVLPAWAPIAEPVAAPPTEPRAAPADWAVAVATGAPSDASGAPEASGTTSATGPVAPPARRGLGTGWIIAIAAGGVLLVGLVVGIGFGVAALGERVADFAESDEWTMDRAEADETDFTFPTAVETYFDGRYDADCPASYEFGCWQMGLVPEESCTRGWYSLSFTGDEGTTVHTDEYELEFVARRSEPVVVGGDEYVEVWIDDVVCLDLRPANTAGGQLSSGGTSPSV